MAAYVKTLTPLLSGQWQVAEMMVKTRGGIHRKGSQGQYQYLWTVPDEESRFHLASEISRTGSEVDATNVFQSARETATAIPRRIALDKLGAYPMGIESAFIDRREELWPEHNRVLSGTCINGDGNQLAERLHYPIRERDMVVRGWKKDETRSGRDTRRGTTSDGHTPRWRVRLPRKWLE